MAFCGEQTMCRWPLLFHVDDYVQGSDKFICDTPFVGSVEFRREDCAYKHVRCYLNFCIVAITQSSRRNKEPRRRIDGSQFQLELTTHIWQLTSYLAMAINSAGSIIYF